MIKLPSRIPLDFGFHEWMGGEAGRRGAGRAVRTGLPTHSNNRLVMKPPPSPRPLSSRELFRLWCSSSFLFHARIRTGFLASDRSAVQCSATLPGGLVGELFRTVQHNSHPAIRLVQRADHEQAERLEDKNQRSHFATISKPRRVAFCEQLGVK